MLLLGDLGNSYERTHSMAWAAAAIGICTCVAPWSVAGDVAHTRSTSNPITGAVALFLTAARALDKKIERAASTDPDDTEEASEHPIDLDLASRQLTWARWAVPAGRVGGGVTQPGSVESRRESRLDITDCSWTAH
ncbi:SPW repeat protein [Streptomyces sp. NPDC007355]|uniref:SPW repeat domain-containing protein n=1 Tax=Streptomyces sp. NPDC007355 TaxID=3364778 RepID=UPI00367F53DE